VCWWSAFVFTGGASPSPTVRNKDWFLLKALPLGELPRSRVRGYARPSPSCFACHLPRGGGLVGIDADVGRRENRGDGDLLIRHGFAMPPSPLGKAWWRGDGVVGRRVLGGGRLWRATKGRPYGVRDRRWHGATPFVGWLAVVFREEQAPPLPRSMVGGAVVGRHLFGGERLFLRTVPTTQIHTHHVRCPCRGDHRSSACENQRRHGRTRNARPYGSVCGGTVVARRVLGDRRPVFFVSLQLRKGKPHLWFPLLLLRAKAFIPFGRF